MTKEQFQMTIHEVEKLGAHGVKLVGKVNLGTCIVGEYVRVYASHGPHWIRQSKKARIIDFEKTSDEDQKLLTIFVDNRNITKIARAGMLLKAMSIDELDNLN